MATSNPIAAAVPPTRQQVLLDARNAAARLHHTMMNIYQIKGNVDPANITKAMYDEDDVITSLADTGVTNWSEFLALGPEDISQLLVPALTPSIGTNSGVLVAEHDLSKQSKRRLRALLAFYHFESRKIARPIHSADTTRPLRHLPNLRLLPHGRHHPMGTTSRKDKGSGDNTAELAKNHQSKPYGLQGIQGRSNMEQV